MDANSPQDYIENTDESIADTEKFIKHVKSSELVTPVITPRFAPSCTSKLMSNLGKLAKQYNLPIQTHISENLEEVKWVKELFPNCSSYTDVYEKHGLLNDRTLLGHGIYLEKDELELIKKRGCTISHCPNSNFTLISGVAPIRKYLDMGVKVALGTDNSGGYRASMLDAMRMALAASDVVSINSKNKKDILNLKELFYLATLGGAVSIGLGDKIGNFIVGKEFDALLVDVCAQDGPFDAFIEQEGFDAPEILLQRFVFCGDDRNILRVFVKGREVKPIKN